MLLTTMLQTEQKIKNAVFWHVTSRILLQSHQYLATTCRLYLLPDITWSTKKTEFFKIPAATTCNLTFDNHSKLTLREHSYQSRAATFFGVLGEVIILKYSKESLLRHLQRL
jgi:hypothetical protein